MKEEEIRKREILNKYLELSAKDIETFFSDRTKFTSTKCPACSSNNSFPAIEKETFVYHQCEHCDTIFVNPRPDIDSLNSYYTDSPSTSYWVNDFFLPVAEVRRKKIFKPRAEYIANYFENNVVHEIADIGAGFGLFLEELQKLEPQLKLTAIEPSNEMAEICRTKKLNVLPLALEDIDAKKYKFEVLTAFELFEHLQNPELFLDKVFELLKPGGHFIFTTLNGLGFDIQVLWDKAKCISPPHHLNFFNPWSIELLLKKKGFEITTIETPGKLDWDIVNGAYTHEDTNPGRLWKSVSKYGNTKTTEDLQNWISKNRFSSHMRVIVRKPLG
jgi:SAM-dependent methyltransferase